METGATERWYFWLIVAAVLFVLGLGALVVMGDGETATGQMDTSLLNGLAWLVWVLSWIGAVGCVGVSIAKGIGQARSGSDTPGG